MFCLSCLFSLPRSIQSHNNMVEKTEGFIYYISPNLSKVTRSGSAWSELFAWYLFVVFHIFKLEIFSFYFPQIRVVLMGFLEMVVYNYIKEQLQWLVWLPHSMWWVPMGFTSPFQGSFFLKKQAIYLYKCGGHSQAIESAEELNFTREQHANELFKPSWHFYGSHWPLHVRRVCLIEGRYCVHWDSQYSFKDQL